MKRSLFSTLKRTSLRKYSTDFKYAPLVLSEVEQDVQQLCEQFGKNEVWPKVREMEKNKQLDQGIIDQLFELGLMGIEVPEEYDGMGMGFMSSIVAVEELSKYDASVSLLVDVQNTLFNRMIRDFGTKEQKEKYMPLVANEMIGSFCLSETSSGTDAFSLKARAVDKGDHWELNGSKHWITNAREAGVFVVMANVDPSKGYKGITSFIVDRDAEGLTVGAPEKKVCIEASSTCPVILENVKIPKENVLGGVEQVGQGYKMAITTLNEGRIGIAAQMIGVAQGALDHAIPYMMEREAFGQPIADFQGLEFQLAECLTKLRAAKLMTYDAARMKEAGMDFAQEASMVKVYSSQVAQEITTKCVQFMGGVGITKDYMAEKYFRDVIVGSVYEGTTNINLQFQAKMEKQKRRERGD